MPYGYAAKIVSSAMTPLEIAELAREIVAAFDPGTAAPGVSCGCDHSVDAAAPERNLDVAALIDQTLLRPDVSDADMRRFLASSREAGFHAVCVQPTWVALATRELRGTGTKVASVVGFPHGSTVTPVKCLEAETAIRLGAREIDMVANIGALLSDDLDAAFTEIKSVAAITSRYGAVLKVILEMPRLNERQKINACVVSKLAGANFVKTSTGFDGSIADVRDVEVMHRVVGGVLGVKAAGGIQTYSDFEIMFKAGATRIGTSRGLEILTEAGAA